MVSPEQVEFYQENGYLVVEEFLTPSELDEILGVVDELIEESRGVSEHDDRFELESTHSADAPALRRLKGPARNYPLFKQYARSDSFADLVEPLMGNHGVRYQHDKLNMKTSDIGSPVEWHQDFAFHPHTNDDLLAIGVALDACTVDNGCLMVIPGSHRWEILDHHNDGVFAGAIAPSEAGVDLDAAVPVTVPAGGVSVHHVRTLHGSAPNRSSQSRRLWLVGYAAADAWPIEGVADLDTFHEYLIRGENTPAYRCTDQIFRVNAPQGPGAGSIFEIQRAAKETVYR